MCVCLKGCCHKCFKLTFNVFSDYILLSNQPKGKNETQTSVIPAAAQVSIVNRLLHLHIFPFPVFKKYP